MSKGNNGAPTAKEIAEFFEKMEQLRNAGIPCGKSLRLISMQTSNKQLKRIIDLGEEKISMGGYFTDVMRCHTKIFPEIIVVLTEVGEITGMYFWKWMADYMMQEHEDAKHFKNLVLQPILLGFVLVSFRMAVLSQSPNMWYYAVLGLCVLLNLCQKSSTLYLFPFKTLTAKKKSYEILAEALSITLYSGLDYEDAVKKSIFATGRKDLRGITPLVLSDLYMGAPLSQAIKGKKQFPRYFCEMLYLGEEVGSVPAMMKNAAETYRNERLHSKKSFQKYQETFGMVALLVGIFSVLSLGKDSIA